MLKKKTYPAAVMHELPSLVNMPVNHTDARYKATIKSESTETKGEEIWRTIESLERGVELTTKIVESNGKRQSLEVLSKQIFYDRKSATKYVEEWLRSNDLPLIHMTDPIMRREQKVFEKAWKNTLGVLLMTAFRYLSNGDKGTITYYKPSKYGGGDFFTDSLELRILMTRLDGVVQLKFLRLDSETKTYPIASEGDVFESTREFVADFFAEARQRVSETFKHSMNGSKFVFSLQ